MQFAFYTKTEWLAQSAKRCFIISGVLQIRSPAGPIPWVLKYLLRTSGADIY